MLNKKFKLQDTLDIYLSDLEDGKVLITFSRMTTRERKEIITHRSVAEFLAGLNGVKLLMKFWRIWVNLVMSNKALRSSFNLNILFTKVKI